MSEPIRTVIADDEAAARAHLRRLLRHRPDFAAVAEAASGRTALAAVRRHDPDVLFLDVQMPGLDGFDVVARLPPERLPCVVFVTAYDQYALRAFEAHAVDYLLKPFDDERFGRALDHVRRRVRERHSTAEQARLRALLARVRPGAAVDDAAGSAPAAAHSRLRRIPIRRRDEIVLLDVDRVEWIEASGDYVRLHTRSESWLARVSLDELERRLGDRFARIHRSAMVRTEAVARLCPRTHGDYDVVLRDGSQLRLSRSYRGAFSRAMGVEL